VAVGLGHSSLGAELGTLGQALLQLLGQTGLEVLVLLVVDPHGGGELALQLLDTGVDSFQRHDDRLDGFFEF